MKANNLKSLSTQELEKKIVDLKQELFQLRFQHATGQLENPMRIRSVKKDIARTYTAIREQKLGV